MKISCIMLVGEYEPYLEYAVKSVEKIVDEIVMVLPKKDRHLIPMNDKFKGRLLLLPQKGKDVDFAKWRNHALKECKGDYILFIDADEVFANMDGSPVTRKYLEAQCKAIDAQGLNSVSFFTYHFLYNYRTIDGRNNGLHFSENRLFRRKVVKGWEGKIHEKVVFSHSHPTSRNIIGPCIFHFGHCKGMEDLRQKYLRSMSLKDNPFRKELRKGETVEQYIARHDLFRANRPMIHYDGPMPSVLKLW